MAVWYTPDTVREQWSGAPKSATLLQNLLDTAKLQVLAFAPVFVAPEGEANYCPVNYRIAQGMQVRAIWDSQNANVGGNEDGASGLDGYQVRTYPMSQNIKTLLRPPQGVPGLG